MNVSMATQSKLAGQLSGLPKQLRVQVPPLPSGR